jgi:hypothetical protein
MLVYFFRDHHSNVFAYSVDVTGRNIPPQTAETKWVYETVISDRDVALEAVYHLRHSGFYVFWSTPARAAYLYPARRDHNAPFPAGR